MPSASDGAMYSQVDVRKPGKIYFLKSKGQVFLARKKGINPPMKFSIISLAVSLALASRGLATPMPQTATTVYHCPRGWRCCGPIQVTLGGTCHEGLTGICPL
ncbi:hypothetical protein BDZ97DRAFT_1827138 [Flammula alnicola]|nr:hypothetical protein BDZ97DRAFT_1827138 [Flammula alnicola]